MQPFDYRAVKLLPSMFQRQVLQPRETYSNLANDDILKGFPREAGLPAPEALNRARLTYAAYVGFLQLNFTLGLPRINHEEFDAYVEHMIATLIPV